MFLSPSIMKLLIICSSIKFYQYIGCKAILSYFELKKSKLAFLMKKPILTVERFIYPYVPVSGDSKEGRRPRVSCAVSYSPQLYRKHQAAEKTQKNRKKMSKNNKKKIWLCIWQQCQTGSRPFCFWSRDTSWTPPDRKLPRQSGEERPRPATTSPMQ